MFINICINYYYTLILLFTMLTSVNLTCFKDISETVCFSEYSCVFEIKEQSLIKEIQKRNWRTTVVYLNEFTKVTVVRSRLELSDMNLDIEVF